MFYSGWQFRTPTSFDLADRTGSAVGDSAEPAMGGGSAISAVRWHPSSTISTSLAATHTGDEPVVYQRIETISTPPAAPAASRGSATDKATVKASASEPCTRNRGVVHLQFSTPLSLAGEAAGEGTTAASRAMARRGGRGSNSAFHLRSDCPLMPQLGVAYMEVQVESLGRASTSGSDRKEKPAPPSPPSALGLVVGVCSDALPSHKLPGEQEGSIGLFYAQSMVYSNGLGEGERVSLPLATAPHSSGGGDPPLQEYFHWVRRQGGGGGDTGANAAPDENPSGATPAASFRRGRRRELKEGDTLGVLVNFIDGTLHFTYNGVLVEGYCGRVDKAEERTNPGSGSARGGGIASLTSNMTVTSYGRSAVGKRSHSDSNGGGYYFAVGLQKGVACPVTLKVVFQSGVQPVPGVRVLASILPPPAAPGGERDRGLSALPASTDLVVFDVAKYATREAERKLKRQYPHLGNASWNEDELNDGVVQAMLRQFFAARGLSKSLASLDKETTELRASASASGGGGGDTVPPPAKGEADPLMAYSDFIADLRKLIFVPDTAVSSSPLCPTVVLEHCCLMPAHRAAFFAALDSSRPHRRTSPISGTGEVLSPHFWGLLLFTRRMDLLFLLKAMQAVELVLDTCEQYLHGLMQRHGIESGRGAKGEQTSYSCNMYEHPAKVESKLLAAYSAAVLLPMENIAKRATRRGPVPPTPSSLSQSSSSAAAAAAATAPPHHSWQELAQLPYETLRSCFFDCLGAASRADEANDASNENEEGDGPKGKAVGKAGIGDAARRAEDTAAHAEESSTRARAEMAATVLFIASVPMLAAPPTATQLRLGESLVSFFTHTQTFFSLLTRGMPSGKTDGQTRAESEGVESAQPAAPPPRAAEAHESGSTSPRDAAVLLRTCALNWFSLIAEARQQYRRRTYRLLVSALDECNQWVGATLRTWLREKTAADALEQQRAVARARVRETHADSSDDEECEDGKGENAPPTGEPSGLHTIIRAEGLPAGTSPATDDPSARPELDATMARQPSDLPSLRALYRRCLATASLDPLAQMSTNYFLTHLANAGNRVDAERAAHDGKAGDVDEESSLAKRPVVDVSAAAAAADGRHPGWIADEFFLGSVYLQRVNQCMFR